MFFIEVVDSQGNLSTLDGFIESDDEYHELYIGDTRGGGRPSADVPTAKHQGRARTRYNSCIHITVIDNEEEAILQDLEYRKTCDLNGNLEESTGTQRMLKGALMYVFQKYPFVSKINLIDVAQKKHTRIYLTPKRILLQKQGWYEEYFGAHPNAKTKSLIHNAIKSVHFTPELIEKIKERSWGKEEHLKELSKESAKLIHSDWFIPRDIIHTYGIRITVKETKTSPSLSGGSLKQLKRMKHSYTVAELKSLTLLEKIRLKS